MADSDIPGPSKRAKISIVDYFLPSCSSSSSEVEFPEVSQEQSGADEGPLGVDSDSEIDSGKEGDLEDSSEDTSMLLSDTTTHVVRLVPNQPRYTVFPTKRVGTQTRSFQYSWFAKWKWLEWDDDKECAFCHPCRMATNLKLFNLSKKAENAFSSEGFRTWKNAIHCFRKHEHSLAHKEGVMKWVHYTKSSSVSVQIAQNLKTDQAKAQKCLLNMLSSLRFLARQGLAIRGHEENEGNFLQLLRLQSGNCSEMVKWLQRRGNWTAHEIQNEILEIMAHSVLRTITDRVKANKYYAIIVDEATDISFKEQVSICLRYVTADTLEAHEDLVGLCEAGSTTAERLTLIIKDVLRRLGVDLMDCRAQAYDGASNMSGRLSGVQARITNENPKAIYVHCFCHSLNLAVQDSTRNIVLVRNTLDTIHELSNLIHFSPKRKDLFHKIKQDLALEAPSLRPLCPTRWTVKAKSFESVLLNYEALLETLQSISTRSDGGHSNLQVVSKASSIVAWKALMYFLVSCLGKSFLVLQIHLAAACKVKMCQLVMLS